MADLGCGLAERHAEFRVHPQHRQVRIRGSGIVVFEVGAVDLQPPDPRIDLADRSRDECPRLRTVHLDGHPVDLLGGQPLRTARPARHLADPRPLPGQEPLFPRPLGPDALIQAQRHRGDRRGLQQRTAPRRIDLRNVQHHLHGLHHRGILGIAQTAVAARQLRMPNAETLDTRCQFGLRDTGHHATSLVNETRRADATPSASLPTSPTSAADERNAADTAVAGVGGLHLAAGHPEDEQDGVEVGV